MRLTAVGSGYFRVYVDGVAASQHTTEREAIEAAAALESSAPSKVVTYKHEYEVRVEQSQVQVPVGQKFTVRVVSSNPALVQFAGDIEVTALDTGKVDFWIEVVP